MLTALAAAFVLHATHLQEPVSGSTKKSLKGENELVYIPAGMFKMGSNDNPNELPIHDVTLDGFWMGKDIITVAQFRAYCKAKPYKYNWNQKPPWGWIDNNPMVLVTWDEARAYCQWAGGDLPTEAQYEKASRGTDGRRFPWGNRFDASVLCTNVPQTAPVGSFPKGASPYGCLDLSGNVCEWCLDFSANNYEGLPDHNPTGPETGQGHILRGGYWGDDNEKSFRTTYRYADRWSPKGSKPDPEYVPGSVRTNLYGFRMASK